MNLNALIISFFFPPFKRVGGRRWAKHCKYFKKENINFYVLAGNFTGTSPWDEDVKLFEDRITRVDLAGPHIPYFKRKLPNSILQKIVWKLSFIFWQFQKRLLVGNFNDASIGNENTFYNRAKSIIIKESINTVIVSGGPFKYASILLLLKKDFPEIKFVFDYRDYWEDGFGELTDKQITYEKNLQQQIVNSVDLILSPNAEMQKHYADTFRKPSYLLPHCIDEDDLTGLGKKTSSNTVQLVYGGAFYENIGENIDLIKKFIDQLNKLRVTKADFYVSIKGYEQELQHPSINRLDFIESRLYFEKVVQADYVILILPPQRVNAMSSKFFELVALRKPILYFGKEGAVSDFILKNKLGFHITESNLTESVDVCLANKASQTIPDPNYAIHEHTFEHQTKKLITQLQLL